MASSSRRDSTRPVGLFGVHTMMARVCLENAAPSRSRSSSWPAAIGTYTGFAPHKIASGP